MTDELEQMRFQAAVFSAHHAKAFAEMLRLLRNDHPLSAADKAALADFIEAERTPDKRGRPPEPLFSPTWRLRRAVSEIRAMKQKYKYKRMTLETAAEIVLIGYQMSGRTLDREQILRELRRSNK
jgi:hypothetical protein